MPKVKQNSQVFELARRGAEMRLRELAQELKLLVGAFPHLRDSFDKDELPLPFVIATGARMATQPTRRARARTMSPAARKAVSQRMKRYWAFKKGGKGGKKGGRGGTESGGPRFK